MSKLKQVFFTLSILCVLSLFTGCWDKRELEDGIFIVLLGIDKADEDGVIITAAFPVTQLEGGNASEEGGEYSVISVAAPSLVEGLNMFSTKLAGPIALFSVKTIVISREIAETEMLRHVFSAWRYEQTRNTTNILISEDKASDFINARISDPYIDVLRQEELLLEQSNRSSFYKPVKLLDMLISLKSGGSDSVAMYGAAVEDEDEEKLVVKKEYLPGEIPVKANNKTEICGLAVFRGAELAGTLNSFEAQVYSMLTEGKTRSIFTIPDPIYNDTDIVISILPTGRGKIHTDISGREAVINIDADLHCVIECVQSDADYTVEENFNILSEYIKNTCKQAIDELIIKIQKEYNADILRLGDKLAKNFKTADMWQSYNWKDRYKNAEIYANVTLTVDRTGIMMP